MNTIIFQECITAFDKRVRLENKDQKCCFLHQIQPLDAGIIAAFKRK